MTCYLMNFSLYIRALQENNKGTVKVTGSQVMLHWLNDHEKAVKQWVTNRVIEILRFTQWFFISSQYDCRFN